jgi:hypothetical protein
MTITIDIEHLILEDISLTAAQQRFLQAALQTELARLIANDGLAEELLGHDTVPLIRADSIEIAGELNPESLGQQIAQAVYRGLNDDWKTALPQPASGPAAIR